MSWLSERAEDVRGGVSDVWSGIKDIGSSIEDATRNAYMGVRDPLESAAVLAGNYYLPGSSALTSKLASEGAQEQLGSNIGQLAQLGTGAAGVYNWLAPTATPTATPTGVPMANAPTYTPPTGFESGGLFNPSGASVMGPGAGTGMGATMTNAGGMDVLGTIKDYGSKAFDALGGVKGILDVAGNLYKGYKGSQAAEEAAQIQADAQQRALDLQREMYLSQLGLQQPFREAGITAQNRLMDLLGLSGRTTAPEYGTAAQSFGMQQFQADPGYAFRLAEGQKALERSAAARGGLLSGGTMKATQRYGQDLASQEYQNAFNRYQAERANRLQPLASLTAAGQGAAGTLSNVAGAYGQQAGAGITDIGRAQAAGQVGAFEQKAGALTDILQAMQNRDIVNALRKSQYGTV